MPKDVSLWEVLQELEHSEWVRESVIKRVHLFGLHVNEGATVTSEANQNACLIPNEIHISDAVLSFIHYHPVEDLRLRTTQIHYLK